MDKCNARMFKVDVNRLKLFVGILHLTSFSFKCLKVIRNVFNLCRGVLGFEISAPSRNVHIVLI